MLNKNHHDLPFDVRKNEIVSEYFLNSEEEQDLSDSPFKNQNIPKEQQDIITSLNKYHNTMMSKVGELSEK